MDSYRRFTKALVATSVVAGTVATLGALAISQAAAQGTALGAVAAGVALGLMARNITRLVSKPVSQLTSTVYRGTAGRMGLYALVFVFAYTLDRSTYHGILGALAGMFLIYVVMMVVGFVTLRAKPAERPPSGNQTTDSREADSTPRTR